MEDFTADNSYLLFNIVEDFAFLGSCWTRQASLEKHWMLIWMLLGPVKLDSNTERPFVVENQDKWGIVRQWGQSTRNSLVFGVTVRSQRDPTICLSAQLILNLTETPPVFSISVLK